LGEDPPSGASTGAGALSQLLTDLTGAPYDFSRLYLNGRQGGNIMTAALTEQVNERGEPVPWLRSIDADHAWRQDNQTQTVAGFRYHDAGAGSDAVRWTFQNLPTGEPFQVRTNWQSHRFVERVDDPSLAWLDGHLPEPLNSANDVTYRIYDGASLIRTVSGL